MRVDVGSGVVGDGGEGLSYDAFPWASSASGRQLPDGVLVTPRYPLLHPLLPVIGGQLVEKFGAKLSKDTKRDPKRMNLALKGRAERRE